MDRLPNLDTLNVSNNKLSSLPNLGCCPSLHTLLCSDNEISSVESLRNLTNNKELTTLDLQNNKFEEIEVWAPQMSSLATGSAIALSRNGAAL